MSQQNFFLLKQSATAKIIDLLGTIEAELKKEFHASNIEVPGLNSNGGKIFRGENYKLFPYIILDCPKLFTTNSIFAFRTMFWWGHEFSFTLHLQGESMELFRNSVHENIESAVQKDIFYCVNDTPWQYTFDRENYVPLEEIISEKNKILKTPFIKLSRKLPVESIDLVQGYSLESLKLFMRLIRSR